MGGERASERGFGVLACGFCDGFSSFFHIHILSLVTSVLGSYHARTNAKDKENTRETKRCLKCPAAAPVPKKRIKYRTQQVLCALFLSSLDTDLLLLASLASFSQKLRLQACRENATLQRLSNDNDTELQR